MHHASFANDEGLGAKDDDTSANKSLWMMFVVRELFLQVLQSCYW
jgi:hypothetical protein